MQPYFCAYIGYYQLISSVNEFVIYDNIQYNKKGWFNRNRILVNGTDRLFTIPIKSDSDYLPVKDRYLSEGSIKECKKILSQIQNFYKKAPYYDEIYTFVARLFLHQNVNLFDFIYYSVTEICKLLKIDTRITVSSTLDIDHNLKAQDKVLEICKYLDSSTYVNSIGGQVLYQKETFGENNIDLKFLKSRNIEYAQFNNPFVPWLSIIDVLMFNGVENTREYLNEYDFV